MEVVRGTAKTVVVTVMVRRGWRARWQGAAGAPAARVVKGGGRQGGGEDGGGEVGGEGVEDSHRRPQEGEAGGRVEVMEATYSESDG